jgi:hypothetical protein
VAPHQRNRQATPKNEWWELFDASRGRPYFYNPSTQQTVWEAPPGTIHFPFIAHIILFIHFF